MNDNNLLKRLGTLGFPLLASEKEEDANLALADLVESGDLRLWEGFPVVLANSAERGLFDYHTALKYLKGHSDKLYLQLLLALSLSFYEASKLKFAWHKRLYGFLNKEGRRQYGNYLLAFKNNQELDLRGKLLSSQRVKANFNNYSRQAQEGFRDFLSVNDELGLEYALSQVFPPKQKELFLKKLRHEKLTKTEREYFSRVVKKRVLALANSELHRLSQKLLQNL